MKRMFSYSHPDGSCRYIEFDSDRISDRRQFFLDMALEVLSDDHAILVTLAKIYRASSPEHLILSDVTSDFEANEFLSSAKAEAVSFVAGYLSRCESMRAQQIDPWWEYIQRVQESAGTSMPREYFFFSEQ